LEQSQVTNGRAVWGHLAGDEQPSAAHFAVAVVDLPPVAPAPRRKRLVAPGGDPATLMQWRTSALPRKAPVGCRRRSSKRRARRAKA
jgi:hypothetical protein